MIENNFFTIRFLQIRSAALDIIQHYVTKKEKSLSIQTNRLLNPTYQTQTPITTQSSHKNVCCISFGISFEDVLYFEQFSKYTSLVCNLKLQKNGNMVMTQNMLVEEVLCLCKEQKKESKSYLEVLKAFQIHDYDLQIRDMIFNETIRLILSRYANHDDKYKIAFRFINAIMEEYDYFKIDESNQRILGLEEEYDKSRIR